MKVCAMQLDITLGQREENYDKVRRLFVHAMERQPEVIVLPELWDVGFYPPNVSELADRDGQQAKEFLQSLAKRYSVHIVGGSVAQLRQGKVQNTNFVVDRHGEIQFEYSKIHLFSPAGEHENFEPGNVTGTYQLDGVKAASIICYDLRFCELVRTLALQDIQVLFIPAAWPHPRLNHWQTLAKARAIENQIYVVALNGVGEARGLKFCGGSLIVNPWGEVVASLEEEEGLLFGELDFTVIQDIRSRINVFRDRRPEFYKLI